MVAKRHQKRSWVLTDYEVSCMAVVICWERNSVQGAKSELPRTFGSPSLQLMSRPTWVVQMEHVI